jgi:hypothetical protein
MTFLALIINLLGISTGVTRTQVAQVQPCVWPNRCSQRQVELLPELAQIQPCVWPNRCSASSAV